MLNKNSMLTGVFIAFIFPAIAWITEFVLKTNTYIINRPAVPYFIAIAINLIILRFCLKNNAEQTGRGIMLATFACMLLIFIFKVHPIR
jgi:hypothetical protein